MNKQQNEPRRVDHHSNRMSLKVTNSIIKNREMNKGGGWVIVKRNDFQETTFEG